MVNKLATVVEEAKTPPEQPMKNETMGGNVESPANSDPAKPKKNLANASNLLDELEAELDGKKPAAATE